MELKELDVRGEMAAVMEIIRGGFAQAPWNETWDDEAALREYIEGLTNAPDSLPLGLWDGSRLAGVSLGRIKRWYWGAEYCIDDLCVLPSMQGRGAGTEFVKLMDEYLRARGVRSVSLWTKRDAPACGFYRKNGFHEGEDKIVFEKEL